MICPKCNNEIPSQDIECRYCGVIVEKAIKKQKEKERQQKAAAATETSKPTKEANEAGLEGQEASFTEMSKCVRCGNFIDPDNSFCPNCGKPRRKESSGAFSKFLLIFIFVLGILYWIGGTGEHEQKNKTAKQIPTNTPSKTEKPPKIYSEGDTVSTGYTSYVAWKSWWADKLTDKSYDNQKPNAKFLFVKLTVRNDDKKARTIPPFKLIDEEGAEYETTNKAWMVNNSIGVLDKLNPGVRQDGVVVFDVPKHHSYKLKASGGYWSTENALIKIDPT